MKITLRPPLSAGGSGTAQTLLLHNQLLGERLYLYSLARFLVVGAIIVGSFFATYVVGVQGLDIPRLLGVAGALAMYNVIVFLMVRPLRARERAAASYALLTGIMHGTIMLDFLFLTMALWLVGGARSPFQAFYLFHVILASIFLSRTAAFLYTLFGYLLLTLLVVGEWLDWIPSYSPAGAVSGVEILDGRYVLTLLVVYGMLFALSVSMLTSLVQLLRAGERDLRDANVQLERLSALRRDFLQIVLHDLKTPMVAVAQHLYNLEAQLRDSLPEQEARWLGRCQLRLREMSDLLNDLQVLAVLESEGIQKQTKQLDLGALLNTAVNENQDSARLRNHALTLELAEGLPPVQGIDRLLREAVTNLITNAIKYTPMGGMIVVRASAGEDGVRIEVRDNGIGISQEDQTRLFQEFGRIRPKKSPQIDTTGSSGLGLAIVRRIVELHGGTVRVQSALHRGSTFIIQIPLGS